MATDGQEAASRTAGRRTDVHVVCPGCGVTRHRALAMIGAHVVRVECRACGGRHRRQAPPPLAHGSGVATQLGAPVVDFDFERYARYFTGKELCDHGERDILAPELLRRLELDYAIASLCEVDRYGARISGERALPGSDARPTAQLIRTVLWSGAYLGEVIRRNTTAGFHWVDQEDVRALDPQHPTARGPRTLPRYAFLCLPFGVAIDPLAMALRCIRDVREPGLLAHARAALRRFTTLA